MKRGMKTEKLRVWWVPQVPMTSFKVEVRSLREAKLLLDTLAAYDAFQFDNRIKPDYSNAGGLQVLDESEGWVDWYDQKSGDDFDEYCRNNPEKVS